MSPPDFKEPWLLARLADGFDPDWARRWNLRLWATLVVFMVVWLAVWAGLGLSSWVGAHGNPAAVIFLGAVWLPLMTACLLLNCVVIVHDFRRAMAFLEELDADYKALSADLWQAYRAAVFAATGTLPPDEEEPPRPTLQ